MTYKYNPFWQQRIRETVLHALDVHPRLAAEEHILCTQNPFSLLMATDV